MKSKYTNKALLNVYRGIHGCHQNFLDVGCGEGWLTRSLLLWKVNVELAPGCHSQLLEKCKKKRRRLLLPDVIRRNWFGKFLPELPYEKRSLFTFALYQKEGLSQLPKGS